MMTWITELEPMQIAGLLLCAFASGGMLCTAILMDAGLLDRPHDIYVDRENLMVPKSALKGKKS